MSSLDFLIDPGPEDAGDWMWARVTSVDPLRIRLDGDSAPLIGKPQTLVSGLEVGNRVWVQFDRSRRLGQSGAQVIIVGRSWSFVAQDLIPPVLWDQTTTETVVLTLASRLGEQYSPTNANLLEVRNSVDAGGRGQLVSSYDGEGMFRIQNALNSKTLIRIRNWGTTVNVFQITDAGGSQVLANWAADGTITAPNIGEPIRGVLNAGQNPAPGTPPGLFLQRAS